ncbi:hypothetical protein COLO4_24343 [Corchorus olitorius]|uniref:Uncharacterized protein n=1 Tax=Corchorus olitorius TaxID=93759 RepID=A0A1R3IAV6_9ROSI|nr:hypothetical protein COLO4_24343 [Corchorus olitorius]
MSATSIEPDPGLRPPIWEIHVDKRNEIRRAYYNARPCQPLLKPKEYPLSSSGRKFRLFRQLKLHTWLLLMSFKQARGRIKSALCSELEIQDGGLISILFAAC